MEETTGEKRELIEPSPKALQYPNKRWGILAIVTMLLFLDVFCVSFFGFINDLTTEYFEVTPGTTDLLSSLNMLARGVVCIFLILAGRFLNFKSLATVLSGTVLIGDFLIVTGLASRSNFAIVAIGQILNGAGATLALTTAQMAANNWFPENQRGIAIATPRIFRKLSPLVSNVVATHSFYFTDETNSTELYFANAHLISNFRRSFQITFAVLALVGFLGYIFSIFFMSDYPPGHEQRPTIGDETDDGKWVLTKELRHTWEALKSLRYVSLVFFYVAFMSIRPIMEWMLSSVVLQIFPDKTDQEVGVLFYIGYAAGACGGPFTGLILDRFKRKKIIFGVGCTFITIFSALFSFALYAKMYTLLYVGYTGTVLFQIYGMICVSHFFIDLKKSETAAAKIRSYGIAITFSSLSQVVYTAISRAIINSGHAQFTPLASVPLFIISGILYVFWY